MKIISVVGARPNFMKIAPFIKAIEKYNDAFDSKPLIKHVLVHTGQHYDDQMSKSFFEQLQIPEADINLGIGSGTHAEQVGKTMIEFEKVLKREKPDWVVVVGDVNATLACSVTAKKEWVKCCHIEAGLRSGDLTMPEEINRLVTDRLSDLLLTPDLLASENLRKEGVPESRIKFVGNIMIDTLEHNRAKAEIIKLDTIVNDNFLESNSGNFPQLINDEYAVITLHRPSNVDDKVILSHLIDFIDGVVAKDLNVIWPIHPRTKKQLELFGLFDNIAANEKIVLTNPLGYIEMLRLNMGAKLMLTDSGGLQEECTILGTPCLTLRWNTERPVTLKEYGGASVLVGNNIERITKEYLEAMKSVRKPFRPELWDGNTAERCLGAILDYV
jgi:UDP-N-acetylglucosamine 2-epimerase (non-hydrolysing)